MRKHLSTCGEPRSPGRRFIRRFALAQVAVQLAVALTPFYAATVRASTDAPVENPLLDSAAQHASGLAQSRDAQNYFSQQATSMATAQVQNWLQQFGTARFELGTDKNFKTNSASLDLLVPLYQDDNRLFFTQTGFRHNDSQNTGNIGLGQRHFVDEWMLGYNAFYDQNLSQGHKRFGLGAEAWRDYLKLSANGYYRISDWKTAKNLTDYEARPANGFDLRAEGWLPSMPMLGGRLMYEQYYGDEVALFGKNKRQKDPSAFTGGLSLTPFPLMTLTADHKTGGGNNDSRFGLQFAYQIGVPLHKQLDRDAVGERRTLAGSAQDLVERNNNIVLEYRKQEVISLRVPAELRGNGSKEVILPIQVSAKYGVQNISVVGDKLIAAGGKIEPGLGSDYRITLPAYTLGWNNSYPLTIVAKDAKGNQSKTVTTQVIVAEPVLDYGNSLISAPLPELIAGTGAIDLTVKLMNTDGSPVTGKAAVMTAQLEEDPLRAKKSVNKRMVQKASISDRAIEAVQGEYVFTLTPGNTEALLKINVAVEGKALQTFEIKQVAADTSGNEIKASGFTTDKDELLADGVEAVEWTVQVVDENGNNAAEGIKVVFATTHGTLTATEAETDAQGQAKVSLSARTVGEAQLKAAPSGQNLVTSDRKVTFTAVPVLQGIAESNDGKDLLANGVQEVRYSVKVLDDKGTPFKGYKVTWENSGVGNFKSDPETLTNDQGIAFIDVSSEKSGSAIVSASVINQTLMAKEVKFIADISTIKLGEIYTESGLKKITYIPGETVLYRIKVEDKFGNGIPNQNIRWGEGSVEGYTVSDSEGVASFYWASSDAGVTGEREMTVYAFHEDHDQNVKEITVTSRAVVGERGRYFWTIHTDYPTADQSQAQEYCAKDAKGRLANKADLDTFASRGFDFSGESNMGEMLSIKYRLGDHWNSKSGYFSSADGNDVGETDDTEGSNYVCVRNY